MAELCSRERPLFHRGDVEGTAFLSVCDGLKVKMQLRIDGPVDQTLRWAVLW